MGAQHDWDSNPGSFNRESSAVAIELSDCDIFLAKKLSLWSTLWLYLEITPRLSDAMISSCRSKHISSLKLTFAIR